MIGRHPHNAARKRQQRETSPALEVGRNRLLFTGAMLAAAFAVIAVRLVDVTMLKDGNEPSIAQAAAPGAVKTGRADIVDRNGVLLATSLKTASLYADPKIVLDPADAARKLNRVLPDLAPAATTAKLEGDRRFVWLRRHLTPRQQYEVNRLGLPGLNFQTEERRVYPLGPLASHVLGHTDVDNRGLAGIERQFDAELRSRGKPLRLTLDIRVQHILHQQLGRAMRAFSAIGAAGMVMDATNGEVVAMVSLPDFDPNQPGAIDPDSRFNRATLGVYEMGSTFKIFNTAMALDAGVVTMRGGYDATDPIRIARFTIRDYHAKRRWLSVPEIFMYSSNIGSAKMALAVGPEAQRAFMARLGMLRAAPIEITEVGAPLIPSPWREINAMTISFGHGISVSPVQLVSGVAAMVNGGVLYAPTLIKGENSGARAGTRIISARTSDQVRRLMRLVVEHGTGSKAEARGYLVGGKTGTAEKVVGRRYKAKALMSSFVAAFPMNAPRYVVFAMVDEPSGTKETFGYATGGWVAAPVVRETIARIAPLLGVRPVDEEAPDIRRNVAVDVVTEKSGKRRLASF
jgi:cell division protein FtsI (penicillin-binding protein 3)